MMHITREQRGHIQEPGGWFKRSAFFAGSTRPQQRDVLGVLILWESAVLVPVNGRPRSAKPTLNSRFPWQSKKLSRVERVIAFLEFLPITKGKLTGSKMKLLPDQRAFIHDIYGRPDDDRVRIGILSQPRGNGKTGLIAGLALCHLLGPECELRGEVYSAAIDR